jgi:hypothetical protein
MQLRSWNPARIAGGLMKLRHGLPAAWLATLCLCLAAAAQQQEPPRYTGQGKIQDLGDGWAKIVDAAGHAYLVAFDVQRGYQVQVVGRADVSYLTPGMLVRFTAELNEKGVAEEPVKRLSIVEQSEVVRPGLQAQVAIGEEPKKQGPQTYVVVGQLRSARRGQITVATPDGAVKAKLDPEAEVEIDVSDYRLARKDDTLAVELGYLFAPPQGEQPGQVLAQKVVIEMDPEQPLTGKTKKSRPAKKDRSAEKAEGGDQDKSPKSKDRGRQGKQKEGEAEASQGGEQDKPPAPEGNKADEGAASGKDAAAEDPGNQDAAKQDTTKQDAAKGAKPSPRQRQAGKV